MRQRGNERINRMTNNSVHNEQMKTTHNDDDDDDEFSDLVFRSNIYATNDVYYSIIHKYIVCMVAVCVLIACLYDTHSACFVCVSAQMCVCVCVIVFFLSKLCFCCSPGCRMNVCICVYECEETRHLHYHYHSLYSFHSFSFAFFIHFICYFISIELAEPLFSFRIKPTFFFSSFHSLFFFLLWSSSILMIWIQEHSFLAPNEEELSKLDIQHNKYPRLNAPQSLKRKNKASIFHLNCICLMSGFLLCA